MKYSLPFLVLATPATANPVSIVHSHSPDAVVFGLALIALAGVVALVQARVRVSRK